MARRTVRRRRNPGPGRRSMLLVNPRRRRNTRKRRTTRRRNSLVVRANPRRRTVRRRASSRRRNPVRRRRTTRRAVARRRNPSRRRRYTARRRNGRKSKAPKVVYRYRTRNPRRRRKNTRRRRNPTFAATLKKIPLVGGILANMAGFAPQAVFGAISVEPTMMAAKFLAPYVPMVPASMFYPLTGLLVASLVQYLPFGSAAMKKQLAIAVASAAGGVGYYKARTGADAEMAAEAGMLELRGVGNLGSVLTVRPQALAGYGYAYNPVHTMTHGHSYSDGMAYQVRPF